MTLLVRRGGRVVPVANDCSFGGGGRGRGIPLVAGAADISPLVEQDVGRFGLKSTFHRGILCDA